MNSEEILKHLSKSKMLRDKSFPVIGLPTFPHRHSLRLMELKIDSMIEVGKDSISDLMLYPFGYHFGDTLINMFDGKWYFERASATGNFMDIAVAIRSPYSGQLIHPMHSVKAYIMDRSKRMSTAIDLLEITTTHSKKELQELQKDEDGWIKLKCGVAFKAEVIGNKSDIQDERIPTPKLRDLDNNG